MQDFKSLWQQALPFHEYVKTTAEEHRGLWEGVYRLARLPEWSQSILPPGSTHRLLVIAEDWCGDAVNTIPALQKWAESVDGLSLRILQRDQNPELMDRYLTNGARSIPIVIGLDEEFNELGHWGPRPTELQAWVMANKDSMPKPERYKEVRRWYARDHGESTIREVGEALGVVVRE